MLIHGGFWRQRYGRELEGGIARDLAARGWAVWNIEYRRLGGEGGWPTTFEDVEAAIRALPVDAARVVAIGHSAGGQLALWAASRSGQPAGAPGAEPAVRLAYSGVTPEQIDEGVSRLAEAVRSLGVTA